MDGPRITRARGWVGIPELSLQEGTARVVEAAGRVRGRALAAEDVVGASVQLSRGTSGQRSGRDGQQRRARESHTWNIESDIQRRSSRGRLFTNWIICLGIMSDINRADTPASRQLRSTQCTVHTDCPRGSPKERSVLQKE